MLEIRCSNRTEIEVSGTAEELRAVSQRIDDFVQSGGTQITFEANSLFDPSPYNTA